MQVISACLVNQELSVPTLIATNASQRTRRLPLKPKSKSRIGSLTSVTHILLYYSWPGLTVQHMQNKAERQREKTEKIKEHQRFPERTILKKKKKNLHVIGSARLKSPLSALWLASEPGATMGSRFPRIWSTKGGQSSTQ